MKHMSYTINPRIEQVRYEAYSLVHHQNWSTREVARHLGYAQSTVVKWSQRKPEYGKHGRLGIPTRSSRPEHHPRQLSQDTVSRILELRGERNQCAEILHHRLSKEGTVMSLSTVKRVLKKHGCTRFSAWKKWHQYPPRPLPQKPGILVEVDTVWMGRSEERMYTYTLLDVCTRWAFAWATQKIDTFKSIQFLEKARELAPFSFLTLQSDHGPEFSRRFTTRMLCQGINHRHSRVRRPTDNGHLERFNRTLQQECLKGIPRNLKSWNREIPGYLEYYNTKRPHMGLNYKTPLEVITSY